MHYLITVFRHQETLEPEQPAVLLRNINVRTIGKFSSCLFCTEYFVFPKKCFVITFFNHLFGSVTVDDGLAESLKITTPHVVLRSRIEKYFFFIWFQLHAQQTHHHAQQGTHAQTQMMRQVITTNAQVSTTGHTFLFSLSFFSVFPLSFLMQKVPLALHFAYVRLSMPPHYYKNFLLSYSTLCYKPMSDWLHVRIFVCPTR